MCSLIHGVDKQVHVNVTTTELAVRKTHLAISTNALRHTQHHGLDKKSGHVHVHAFLVVNPGQAPIVYIYWNAKSIKNTEMIRNQADHLLPNPFSGKTPEVVDILLSSVSHTFN